METTFELFIIVTHVVVINFCIFIFILFFWMKRKVIPTSHTYESFKTMYTSVFDARITKRKLHKIRVLKIFSHDV